MKTFVVITLGIAIGVLVVGLLSVASFALYEYYAPRVTAVDNRVYHASAQYQDGMANRLEQYYESYQAGDQNQKNAIRSIVRHDFASFDDSTLPSDLHSFLVQMKGYNN